MTSEQSSVTSFSYNGLGDRLTQDGTQYTLDLNAGLTQVLDDGTNSYTYGLDRISQTGTDSLYFLGDGLNSARALTDASGAAVLTNSYEPYGELYSTSGTATSPFGYGGEWTDPSGLQYLRARYYNPADGRFLSRDMWGGDYDRPLSLNRWMYVEGNPVNLVDPSGMSPNSSYGDNLRDILVKRYDWHLHDTVTSIPWADYDILAAFNMANDIEKFVNGITSGGGRDWMRKYLGGVNITIGRMERGFGIPSKIGLPSWWPSAEMGKRKYYLAHEMGHIWDAHTGKLGFYMYAEDQYLHYGLSGITGGVADDLNDFINAYLECSTDGSITSTNGSRFSNPDQSGYVDSHIPPSYEWDNAPQWSDDYGNGATADYLAEAFAYSVYDKKAIPGGANGPIAEWVKQRIYVEYTYGG